MIKAASPLLFLLSFLAAVSPLGAQTNPGDVGLASGEGFRRQAATIELRQKLVQAEGAQQRKDLVSAARLYEQCQTLVERIGSNVDAESKRVTTGLDTVLLELARDAMKQI